MLKPHLPYKFIFFIVMTALTVTVRAQSLSAPYRFYKAGDYELAEKVFRAKVKNTKEKAALNYGLGLVLSEDKYEKRDYYKAFGYLRTAQKSYALMKDEERAKTLANYGFEGKDIDGRLELVINKAFEEVAKANTEDEYDKFISRYGAATAELTDSAKVLKGLLTLEKERLAYEKVRHMQSIRVLADFIKLHPSSPYADTAYLVISDTAAIKKQYFSSGKIADIEAFCALGARYAATLTGKDSTEMRIAAIMDTTDVYENGPLDFRLGYIYRVPYTHNARKLFIKMAMEIEDADKALLFIQENRSLFKRKRQKRSPLEDNFRFDIDKLINYYIDLKTTKQPQPEIIYTADSTARFTDLRISSDQKIIAAYDATRRIWRIREKNDTAWVAASQQTKVPSKNASAHATITSEKDRTNVGCALYSLDLWALVRTADGKTQRTNLGPKINSRYDEKNPVLSDDERTLYFTTDGRYGLGESNIFKAYRLRDDSWTEWSEPEYVTYVRGAATLISPDGGRVYWVEGNAVYCAKIK